MDTSKKKSPDQKKLIEELQKQVAEYLDGWKRCKADFENYKKQQEERADSFRIYATEDILLQIIPVIDNFELAVDHIPQTPENKLWKEGILHIKKQLDDILSSQGVKKIDLKSGDLFDPNIHECIADNAKSEQKSESCTEDCTEHGESFVVEKITRNGYIIGEKLLRPAQVTIRKA